MYDYKYIIIGTIIALIVFILIDILINRLKKEKKIYVKRNCLMTNTELKYFNALKGILSKTPYTLIPQVPLSGIVERQEPHSFQNELNRVIDFVVFSPELSPLLCIEVNDMTHMRKDRKERDKKVKGILKSAKLPLLTIWTKDEFNIMEIAKAMRSYGLKIDLSSIYITEE